MRLLVIVQDLRISGTSAGIGRRSLLAKLREAYPDAIIDVDYLIHLDTEDRLDLLPVNRIQKHIVNTKIPWYIIFLNRFYWRLFNVSLKERYLQKQYTKLISAIDYKVYDHIFITSAGIKHEAILATYNLPILTKAILIFHDPYPMAWYVGATSKLDKLELFRLKRIIEVVKQAKTCSTTAQYMSHDLQHLYAAKKKFYTLAHQFDLSVFDLSDTTQVLKKSKKVRISYHGAIMFGRNANNLLEAYQELLMKDSSYIENTEFILRVKGDGIKQLKQKFSGIKNIKILDTLNFSNSYNEQIHESDIVIILENGPLYCNVLVGKTAFLAAHNKPVLCISPKKSELRNIINNPEFIAGYENKEEIKMKLENLIQNRLNKGNYVNPFGDYFGSNNFKEMLDAILLSK